MECWSPIEAPLGKSAWTTPYCFAQGWQRATQLAKLGGEAYTGIKGLSLPETPSIGSAFTHVPPCNVLIAEDEGDGKECVCVVVVVVVLQSIIGRSQDNGVLCSKYRPFSTIYRL